MSIAPNTRFEHYEILAPLGKGGMGEVNVGWIFGRVGQYDQMHEQGRKLLELEPNFFGGHYLIGVEAWIGGRYEQAISELQKAMALGGGHPALSNLGCLYGILGEQDKARQVLDELLEQGAPSGLTRR